MEKPYKNPSTFSYKLVVSRYLESKIRVLCKRFPHREWSGILFYEVKGSFDKDLVVTGLDLFLMHIGTGATTEVEVTPDIPGYIANHPELIGKYMGIIHSHNVMKSFFSQTDITSLYQDAEDQPHAVSLIVNNEGQYVAKITRRCTRKIEGTETGSYPTWGGKEVIYAKPYVLENSAVEDYDLTIQKESAEDDWAVELLERVVQLSCNSKSPFTMQSSSMVFGKGSCYSDTTYAYPAYSKPEVINPVVKTEESDKEDWESAGADINYEDMQFDQQVAYRMVMQLLKGAVVLPDYIVKEDDIKREASSMILKFRAFSTKDFQEFANEYVGFLLTIKRDWGSLENEEDEDLRCAILAYNVHKILKGLPGNRWLDAYMEELEEYII